MRGWNVEHPGDEVAFFGFDIQQPWYDGPALMAFIDDVAPAEAEQLNEGISRCNGVGYASAEEYASDPTSDLVDPADHEACLTALDSTEIYFADNQSEIVSLTPDEALGWANINRVGLKAWQESRFIPLERDRGMAYVFQKIWELRHPDERVAIWAHNGHIDSGTPMTMGNFIVEVLGDEYNPIALVGYEVSTNWEGLGVQVQYPPDLENVSEVMLHDHGYEYLLVDLTSQGGDDPLFVPGTEYHVGGAGWIVPADHFGALVFLDKSEAMDPICWE
jgi:erythromycin esterase-like protein